MPQINEIILILLDIRSTHNVGSILRSADVFAVSKVYFCGYTPYPAINNDRRLPHLATKITKQISKAALGAEQSLDLELAHDSEKLIQQLRQTGYVIASLEQNEASVNLAYYKPPAKIALVLGNELNGLPLWTLEASDVILEIEQHGQKESLNVANALAIALYALRSKK